MALTNMFKRPKELFKKLFGKKEKDIQTTTSKSVYHPTSRPFVYKRIKHPLHKHHFGNFSPIKAFK